MLYSAEIRVRASSFLVRTDDNQADFFTKVLPGRKFFPLRNLIMNVEDRNLDVPRSRGDVEM